MRSTPVLLVLLWVALPRDAFAYLDPGSASVLFQAAAGAFFTALFVLKRYWTTIKGWVTGRRNLAAAPQQALPQENLQSPQPPPGAKP